MPEDLDRGGPEELLAGSDRPRPLPPVLRARLERSLFGLSGATAPRPLSPEVRDRLENSLRGPTRDRQGGPWRRIAPGAGVAAAIAVLAAIVVPQLVNSPTRTGGTVAAKAAGPQVAPPQVARPRLARPPVARPRLSPSSSAASYGTSNATAGGTAHGVARRGGPARPAPGSTSGAPGPRRALRPTRTAPAPAAPGPMAAVLGAPLVDGVSPHHGPTVGGNWVVVTGQGFVGVSAVHFGATAATSFAVESPVRLKVRAPAHAAGTVDVIVTGATGRSRVAALDKYRFGP